MTEQQHPITPPPELVQQWHDAWIDAKVKHDGLVDFIATHAAHWGSDQELEACVEWIAKQDWTWTSAQLRAARRPKPPSLKEQALEVLNEIESGKHGWLRVFDKLNTIRRALEALPND